jgi:hypothetical protein
MRTLRNEIFTHWTLMRLIRVVLGGMIVVQAFNERNILFGILGLLFAGMAILNVGCCGGGACTTTQNNNKGSNEFSYEEVV